MNGKWKKSFNSFFYNTSKNKIIKTHYSKNLIWNKFFRQPSLQTFHNQPIYKLNFLKTSAVVISPKNGIIKRNSSGLITLFIQNLDTTIEVDYVYDNDKYAKKPTLIKKGKVTKLVFEAPLKSSFLNIFFNKKSALQYKVL